MSKYFVYLNRNVCNICFVYNTETCASPHIFFVFISFLVLRYKLSKSVTIGLDRFILLNYYVGPKMTMKIDFNFLELLECRRDYPYMTANGNFLSSLLYTKSTMYQKLKIAQKKLKNSFKIIVHLFHYCSRMDKYFSIYERLYLKN